MRRPSEPRIGHLETQAVDPLPFPNPLKTRTTVRKLLESLCKHLQPHNLHPQQVKATGDTRLCQGDSDRLRHLNLKHLCVLMG